MDSGDMERIETVLASRDEPVAGLGRDLCRLILDRFRDAVVTVDGDRIGFGLDAWYKGLLFTVSAARRHVTLGIVGGASLPDPAGLLEGAGRVHRHTKIRSSEELRRRELHDLITAALASRDT